MRLLYEDTVRPEYVDYNKHLNDAAYFKIFSEACYSYTSSMGMDEKSRDASGVTIFTLESHIVYLKEIVEGEAFKVFGRVLDYDKKRIHAFLEMQDTDGNRLATYETMLMAVNQKKRRAGEFPENVQENIRKAASESEGMEWPKEARRSIGIRRKTEKR